MRRLLGRYKKELRVFEKALRASEKADKHSPAIPPGAPPEKSPEKALSAPYTRDDEAGAGVFRLCGQCGEPLPHAKTPEARKRHMFLWTQRKRVRRSWAKRPPGSPERRQRMLAAWAARRRAKDDRIVASTHPHVLKLLGRKEVLRRAGR